MGAGSFTFCGYFLRLCNFARGQVAKRAEDGGVKAGARMLGLAMGLDAMAVAYAEQGELAPRDRAYGIFQQSCDACHSTLFALHGNNALRGLPSSTNYCGGTNNYFCNPSSYLSLILQKEVYASPHLVPRRNIVSHEIASVC